MRDEEELRTEFERIERERKNMDWRHEDATVRDENLKARKFTLEWVLEKHKDD